VRVLLIAVTFFAIVVVWQALPLIQVVRGVLLAAQIMVIVVAFHRVGLSSTQSVFALHPLLATLLAIPILGETVGWRRLAAVGVGFLGVLVIMRPGTQVFDPDILIAFLAAVMFAFYGVLTRMVARADGSGRPAFFYTGVAGCAFMCLVGPFFWDWMTPSDYAWMALLCVTGMSGHYFLIQALDATEAVRIQPFIYLQMVFAIAIGAVVFGEAIDPAMILGMAMIIGAGLYAIWREAAHMRAARREDPAPR